MASRSRWRPRGHDARAMTKTTQTRGEAITKALVLVAALASAALFVFLLRRRSFHGAGSSTAFLVASAALALLYASAIFWRSSARLKLLLVSFSLVGSVYLAEIALTVILKRSATPTVGTPGTLAPTADHRTKLEVVRDLRAAGKDAWPTVHPPDVPRHRRPPGGRRDARAPRRISHARAVYCLESDAYALFDSDEHGFNNPPGLHQKTRSTSPSSATPSCRAPASSRAKTWPRASAPLAARAQPRQRRRRPAQRARHADRVRRAAPPRVVLWFYYEGNDLPRPRGRAPRPRADALRRQRFFRRPPSQQEAIDAALKSFVEKKRDVIREEEPRASSPSCARSSSRPCASAST